jgi:hypothetical protein
MRDKNHTVQNKYAAACMYQHVPNLKMDFNLTKIIIRVKYTVGPLIFGGVSSRSINFQTAFLGPLTFCGVSSRSINFQTRFFRSINFWWRVIQVHQLSNYIFGSINSRWRVIHVHTVVWFGTLPPACCTVPAGATPVPALACCPTPSFPCTTFTFHPYILIIWPIFIRTLGAYIGYRCRRAAHVMCIKIR